MQTLIDAISEWWIALPSWVQVIPILLGGWLLALFLRLFVAGAFGLLRLDHAAERTGFAEFLRKGQVSYTPSKLVGAIVFWVVLGGAFVKAANILEVGIIRIFAERFAEIIPAFIVAALIAVLGIVLILFLANFTVTVARNAGFARAELVGRTVKWVGIALVVVIAVEQVSVGKTMLGSLALILFGAAAFGAALAFGLGCKDLARDSAVRWIAALRERRRMGGKGDLEG